MHRKLEQRYAADDGVVFFHLQTVFEGADTNTPKRGQSEAKNHRIESPVGFDARVDGSPLSSFMERYRTGGTPWSLVIDAEGKVRHGAFTSDEATLVWLIDDLRAERDAAADAR